MLLATMAAILSAAAAPAADAGPICQDVRPESAVGSPGEPSRDARPKRLDELPPANLVLTVLRSENGCTAPVIVRYGFGAPPER